MFDAKSLNTLEYPQILARLSDFAQSQGGKKKARCLVPFETISEADDALNETAEADKVFFEYSLSPNFAVDDVADILIKAKKGAVLSIADILKVGRSLRVAHKQDDFVTLFRGREFCLDMLHGIAIVVSRKI